MHLKPGVLLILISFLFSGCATSNQPLINIDDSPMIGINNPSLKNIEDAILALNDRSKWQFVARKPGHIVGTLNINDTQATIDITYNTKTYNIHYNDSKNLNYDGKIIDSRYNGWITKLDRNIRSSLQRHLGK